MPSFLGVALAQLHTHATEKAGGQKASAKRWLLVATAVQQLQVLVSEAEKAERAEEAGEDRE
jgi:hypothetical protein